MCVLCVYVCVCVCARVYMYSKYLSKDASQHMCVWYITLQGHTLYDSYSVEPIHSLCTRHHG